MTPIAVSCEKVLATTTGKGLCKFVKVNWGCFCPIISALLTSDKLQQLSRGRGRATSADVMGTHKICLFCKIQVRNRKVTEGIAMTA